jgi:DNA-binding winged helix-turn-helix (wHTH) protein
VDAAAGCDLPFDEDGATGTGVTSAPRRTIRFGRFELDEALQELRKDGRVVPVGPQPLKLLALLLRHAGEVLTRDEIRQVLWPPDTFVDFDQGMNASIRQIREVLRDNPDSPLYIQTIPKRGYRFIAPVTAAPGVDPDALWGPDELHRVLWENIVELRIEQRRLRHLIVALAAGLLVAVMVAVTLLALR